MQLATLRSLIQDLEENYKTIVDLKNRLNDLGDSL